MQVDRELKGLGPFALTGASPVQVHRDSCGTTKCSLVFWVVRRKFAESISSRLADEMTKPILAVIAAAVLYTASASVAGTRRNTSSYPPVAMKLVA
eukprot:18420-Amorphochlora_amoeboformis.AAC.2